MPQLELLLRGTADGDEAETATGNEQSHQGVLRPEERQDVLDDALPDLLHIEGLRQALGDQGQCFGLSSALLAFSSNPRALEGEGRLVREHGQEPLLLGGEDTPVRVPDG